jgi:hypothetical protein
MELENTTPATANDITALEDLVNGLNANLEPDDHQFVLVRWKCTVIDVLSILSFASLPDKETHLCLTPHTPKHIWIFGLVNGRADGKITTVQTKLKKY